MSKNKPQALTDWRQGRGYVHSFVCDRIAAAQFCNRALIVKALKEAGLAILRQTADDITILDPDTGNSFTLRGTIYRRNWVYSQS
ncbi:hypothetical protein AAIB41_16645 [Brucella sp. BE17]|uniref:hypothetical protein n=1 Tax=Brucella sp. BE17 TaxID=3142977 RepID=UPI0031BB898C